jgi:electron transfer flavoprotein alpha subunit
MAQQPRVWVFAEVEDGKVAEVSLELVTKAGELAARLGGGRVGAFLMGGGVASLAAVLFAYGCDDVYLTEDPALRHYRTLPYAEVVSHLIAAHRPEIVLFGATTTGRDLAPRVASELQVGLTADCTDLQIGPHKDIVQKKSYEKILYQIRPAFGGNIIATIVSPEARPQMATVRPGVMHKGTPVESRKGNLIRVPANLSPESLVVEVLERIPARKKVNLSGANIIVAGGAGVGSKENFELIRELAHVVGAEVGASRAAVDAGYIEKAHQVGQTGTTVRPKLYIACGISGAVQHRVGMQNSGKIVAINTDPDAPIMNLAHYGIVGNLNEVIPKLIEAYKENTK